MKSICFLFFTILFMACSKEDNCIDHTVGTYTGHITGLILIFQGDIILSKATSGGPNLVIQDNLLVSGGITYTGTLSDDCKTITVPPQNIMYGGVLTPLSGFFQIDSTSMTGNLTANLLSGNLYLTYYMDKK